MAVGASLWEAGYGTLVGGIRASGPVAGAQRGRLSREVAWEELTGLALGPGFSPDLL